MLLIGMLDSPFVRRVAVSMKLLDVPFEHGNWSVGPDLNKIRRYNPLGRVPTLVLDDGEVLIDSGAILDYLDDRVGAQRALLPASGEPRRRALQLVALAIGVADKAREQIYERVFRPAERRHQPWVERCRAQMQAGLAELERHCAAGDPGQWSLGGRMTQADITTTCAVTFASETVPLELARSYPALAQLVARCEALPEFRATHTPWFSPAT